MPSSLPWSNTHPHIQFWFNVEKLGIQTVSLLGECSSKIEHVSGVPLRADTAEALYRTYVARGVHATTAIEGNTLTEAQVKDRLRGQLTLPPSQDYLGNEVDNMGKAYKCVDERNLKELQFALVPDDLRNFNRIILTGLTLEQHVLPGEYRKTSVGVGDYRAPDHSHMPRMVEELCRWLNDATFAKPIGSRFVAPMLRAILAHLYVAWIHPFGDGNGRTARIMEYDILVRAEVPLVCAHLLSDYYNRTRTAYYRALSEARGGAEHFVAYAATGFLELLKEQLALIRRQHTEVAWINYVHSVFSAKDHSEQARRRREVSIALAMHRDPIPPEEVPKLGLKIAGMYARRTPRTLQRDIRRLRHMQLVRDAGQGRITANLEIMQAFLPARQHAEGWVEKSKEVPKS